MESDISAQLGEVQQRRQELARDIQLVRDLLALYREYKASKRHPTIPFPTDAYTQAVTTALRDFEVSARMYSDQSDALEQSVLADDDAADPMPQVA